MTKRTSKTNRRIRYLLPVFLFLLGAWYAYEMITDVTSTIMPIASVDVMSIHWPVDISFILVIAIPALLIEYALIAVPAAGLLLLYASIVRSASYEMNIMNIGTEFGGVRMVRRAVAPALFSLSSSGILKGPIENYLFGSNPTIPVGMEISYNFALALMAGLLFLPISLAFFMPTWVLNDSGIVTHLKDDKLNIRQCPDTQGVGRWIGNVLGGFAIIAYPISAFTNYFWERFFVEPYVEMTIDALSRSLFWTVGLPFLVMAFVLPVIAANELNQKRLRRQISGIATKMGATVVLKPQIEKIDSEKAFAAKKRVIKKEGILETSEVAEIITSAKGIKKPKSNKKKKKPANKKK
ncbi:MAG: hypothetical protein ACFFD6_02485 [Candidatus Thorarchaeota archaeon]